MVNKRFLMRFTTSSQISEVRVLEISPNGENLKLQWDDRSGGWYDKHQLENWVLVDTLK